MVGIVIGMAARPALTNVLAGVQIALSEPIRLDDVVIVEGEWGWIEEINPTYVVVRIWDLRRLVLPLSYFIEHPFQNWTRTAADILGTVFVYADYSVAVEEVRQELHRILQSSDLWDGKVWNLQVTNATEHTVELRALMSSVDSGNILGPALLRPREADCIPEGALPGEPASHAGGSSDGCPGLRGEATATVS